MENNYDFDFILELEKNNEWLIEKIKKNDFQTYELLQNAKRNIYFLNIAGIKDIVNKLVQKYKELLINAYPYYIAITKTK